VFEIDPPDEPCPDCGSTKHRACHACETPLDGAIQHRWKCRKCGKVWEVVGFYGNGNSEYEEIDNAE
jgi:transposase-like protein